MSQALRDQLRDLVRAALLNSQTLAGDNVFLPRDWPINNDKMPAILLQTRRWHADSRGRSNAPSFWTVTWIEVTSQLDGTDPGIVEDDLAILAGQVEQIVMGLVIGPPQRFSRILAHEAELDVTAIGARHTGEAKQRFGFEYPEDYEPTGIDDLDDVRITVDEPDGTPEASVDIALPTS